MRCKEHFQGDRCKQDADHIATVHVGQFSQWEPGREPQRIHEQTREIERDEDSTDL
jgi:hypothetical protein